MYVYLCRCSRAILPDARLDYFVNISTRIYGISSAIFSIYWNDFKACYSYISAHARMFAVTVDQYKPRNQWNSKRKQRTMKCQQKNGETKLTINLCRCFRLCLVGVYILAAFFLRSTSTKYEPEQSHENIDFVDKKSINSVGCDIFPWIRFVASHFSAQRKWNKRKSSVRMHLDMARLKVAAIHFYSRACLQCACALSPVFMEITLRHIIHQSVSGEAFVCGIN